MKKSIERSVTIVEDDTPQEVLAKSIVQIAEAARKLTEGPLTMHAIEILIQSMTSPPIRRGDVRLVLESAAALDKRYLKKPGTR